MDRVVDGSDLAAVVVSQLRGRSLATAESCTAGRVGQAFAAVGGALEWFRGGVIAYQDGVKRSLLSVEEPSVLSEAAAREMAIGARHLLDADVTVATTGLVGDQPEDGVAPGTIFIATAVGDDTTSRTHRFDGDPTSVVESAVRQALDDLIIDLTTRPATITTR